MNVNRTLQNITYTHSNSKCSDINIITLQCTYTATTVAYIETFRNRPIIMHCIKSVKMMTHHQTAVPTDRPTRKCLMSAVTAIYICQNIFHIQHFRVWPKKCMIPLIRSGTVPYLYKHNGKDSVGQSNGQTVGSLGGGPPRVTPSRG